ncbi:cadmium resistance transporter [Planosporangium sp. 12N6]|uniref:cadmium resistance transporter n=1 Tax=Planosporangium spinosum TaxID=3402278 RepID=UPI003CFB83B4
MTAAALHPGISVGYAVAEPAPVLASAPARTAVPWPIVGDILGTVTAAVGVFAGTNVDDVIVLTVLFLSSRAGGSPRPWQIWAGQYAGVGGLVAVSAVAALGLAAVPDAWIRLLGLVPLGLGVRGLVRAVRDRGADEPAGAGAAPAPAGATGLWSVAGVTMANGADNLSVYPTVFRAVGAGGSAITIAVFALLIAVWCLAGSWLGSHRGVVAMVGRYGHWLVPAVFIVIGVAILLGVG